jgi:hypothetical protein
MSRSETNYRRRLKMMTSNRTTTATTTMTMGIPIDTLSTLESPLSPWSAHPVPVRLPLNARGDHPVSRL